MVHCKTVIRVDSYHEAGVLFLVSAATNISSGNAINK